MAPRGLSSSVTGTSIPDSPCTPGFIVSSAGEFSEHLQVGALQVMATQMPAPQWQEDWNLQLSGTQSRRGMSFLLESAFCFTVRYKLTHKYWMIYDKYLFYKKNKDYSWVPKRYDLAIYLEHPTPELQLVHNWLMADPELISELIMFLVFFRLTLTERRGRGESLEWFGTHMATFTQRESGPKCHELCPMTKLYCLSRCGA